MTNGTRHWRGIGYGQWAYVDTDGRILGEVTRLLTGFAARQGFNVIGHYIDEESAKKAVERSQ